MISLSALSSVPSSVSDDEVFEDLMRRSEPWVGEEGEGGYVLVVLSAQRGGEGKGEGKERESGGVRGWVRRWRRLPRK